MAAQPFPLGKAELLLRRLVGAGIAAVWAFMGVVLGRAYGRATPPAA